MADQKHIPKDTPIIGSRHCGTLGASVKLGRPFLPPEKRKERLVTYVSGYLVKWVEESGGDAFMQRLLEREYNDL